MAVEFAFDFDKALAAIVYLAEKRLPALDKYKLCKLLVLADKLHLVRYGRPITGDELFALEWGPIPSETLNALNNVISNVNVSPRAVALSEFLELDRRFKNPRFSAKASYNPDVLSESDRKSLDEVAREHGDKSFEQLKALTHEMYAYRKAWGERPESQSRARMNYEDLFEEDSDAVEGALEEMLENDTLRKAFR